jgi:hypothetical protein
MFSIILSALMLAALNIMCCLLQMKKSLHKQRTFKIAELTNSTPVQFMQGAFSTNCEFSQYSHCHNPVVKSFNISAQVICGTSIADFVGKGVHFLLFCYKF